MESRGKMGRGKGSGFDPQLGRQWGLGFLEAANVRVSGKLSLILEGFAQWGKFAAPSAFYPLLIVDLSRLYVPTPETISYLIL